MPDSDAIVRQIEAVFRRDPDRVFLIESMTQRSWTFAQMHEWGLRAASLLKAEGVGKGDRVGLLLANSAEFVAFYFGCLFLGAVAVPVNQALHTSEITYILEHSGVRLVLFSRCTRSIVLQATQKMPSLRQVRVSLGQEQSFHPEDAEETWNLDSVKPDASITPLAGVSDDDLLLILFTSGTTGMPKGVVHCVRSEFGNALAFNKAMSFGPDHRFLHLWPMAYSSGYLNTLMSPFMAGSSVVLTCAFTAQTILNFWKPVKDHQANTLWLSPTMMTSLLRMDRDQDGHRYCRENVRTVCVGTAPLALKLKKDFEARYGVECMESYGLSELLILCANTPSHPRKENAVGRLLEGVELSVSDEQGVFQAGAGSEGELMARTRCRMLGYLDAESLQVQALDEAAWFPTGDIGLIDADGDVFITGRKKDLIIRGGQNLSPRGIREVLLNHPSVEDAVVVGIPHDFYGEEVAAALRLKPGLQLADEQSDILTHCRRLLAQAAVPTRLRQVEEFPLGSTGKILNREVRALLMTPA